MKVFFVGYAQGIKLSLRLSVLAVRNQRNRYALIQVVEICDQHKGAFQEMDDKACNDARVR